MSKKINDIVEETSALSSQLTPDQLAAIEARSAQEAVLQAAKPAEPIAVRIVAEAPISNSIIPMANPETPKAPEVKRDVAAELLAMCMADRKPVRGMFKFYESAGGTLSFPFRKYKQDEVKRWDFVDGQIYTIPLGVAKHLNKSGSYPIHGYINDETGRPVAQVAKNVHRYGFSPLDFMDNVDIGEASALVTVSPAY